MAIFVSNPTSSAITTLSPDALDPSVISPEEGFTEELAAAMQPSAAPTDALAKTPLDMPEEAVKKASDLQILPAEVLLNAVGDANFAFAGQTGTANSAAQNSVPGAALTDATETLEQDNTVLDLSNPLQGAELAAANLAAQMSASVANVPVALASNSTEVSAVLSINATSGAGQNAGQASQAPVTGPSLQEAEQVSSATTLASAQNTTSVGTESANAINLPTGNQPARLSPVTTAQVELAKSVQSDATSNVSQVNAASTANAVSTFDAQVQQAVEGAVSNKLKSDGLQAQAVVQQTAIVNQASPQAIVQVAVGPSSTLKTEANSVTANVSSNADATAANVAGTQSTPLAASIVANSSDAKITRTDSTQAAAINASNSTPSIGLTNVVSEKTAASSDTKVEAQAAQGQESAFNFDAKLAKSDAQQNPKALETPVSLAGVAKTNAQVQNASFTPKGAELGIQAAAATGTQIGTNANTSASANANNNYDANTLELLHALSIADGEATGSAGWSDWKATLVADLVSRARRAIAGIEVAQQPILSQEQIELAAKGELRVNLENHSSGYAVEVISPDKPGLLSIVAGVFNISRLDVKSARTKTVGNSAVMYWIVTPEPYAPEITQPRLHQLIADALVDSTDVEERILARAEAYASIPTIPVPDPEVEIFTDAATDATVIEVRSHDRPGLLFRIGAAITQSKIDIRSAIVTTLGAEAIDTLYVTELTGGPLTSERANQVASHLKQALK